MAIHHNEKDFSKYVDYLLPALYGNHPEFKERLVENLGNITVGDTSRIKIVEVLKYTVVDGQYQALLLDNFGGQEGYIFAVSDDRGTSWLFTTLLSKEIQFHQIKEMIPSIDIGFSDIVDPSYGKRVNYEIGETIAPFNYIDIYGNVLSSNSLQGKVIVLNFWFPSCPPCIKEIPELNEIVERMKGKEIVFIAPAPKIYTSKEELINEFLPKHGFNYEIVLINNKDYSITSFPTHILIDKNLKITDRISGYSPDNIKTLEKKISELLGQDE